MQLLIPGQIVPALAMTVGAEWCTELEPVQVWVYIDVFVHCAIVQYLIADIQTCLMCSGSLEKVYVTHILWFAELWNTKRFCSGGSSLCRLYICKWSWSHAFGILHLQSRGPSLSMFVHLPRTPKDVTNLQGKLQTCCARLWCCDACTVHRNA